VERVVRRPRLTAREVEVLQAIADGHHNREITELLAIRQPTVNPRRAARRETLRENPGTRCSDRLPERPHLLVRGSTGANGVELPIAGNAFEFVFSTIIELDSRACNEVLDGS
jgi:Bacterial regulatory proteins, luxR family